VRGAAGVAAGFTFTATLLPGETTAAPVVPTRPVPPMTPLPLTRPLASVPGVAMPGVVVVPSVSAPPGTPMVERASNVPAEVCPGDWPSALLPLSFAKLVSRPNVAWLGVPVSTFVDMGVVVVVVVLVPLFVPVPVVPVLLLALDEVVGRPAVVFGAAVERPVAPVEVVPVDVVLADVVPAEVVPLVTADGVVVAVVAAAGRAVVVEVTWLAAAKAALAVSESTTAAVMWAGDSVFI